MLRFWLTFLGLFATILAIAIFGIVLFVRSIPAQAQTTNWTDLGDGMYSRQMNSFTVCYKYYNVSISCIRTP